MFYLEQVRGCVEQILVALPTHNACYTRNTEIYCNTEFVKHTTGQSVPHSSAANIFELLVF